MILGKHYMLVVRSFCFSCKWLEKWYVQNIFITNFIWQVVSKWGLFVIGWENNNSK